MKTDYQICSRCVMDNASDPYIIFNERGECNYCTNAFKQMEKVYHPDEEGALQLKALINKLKEEGIGRPYDCLMGISGGLDSAYLAYLGTKKWGLRICAVHIDDGFDTDLAINNIKNLCGACGIELIHIKPDAEQYADIIKTFIRAEVPNIAIPQDNILLAILYKYARDYKIKYFLSGTNFALESILQLGNTYGANDLYHIKQIHKKFGTKSLTELTFISQYRRDIDKLFLGIKTICPLDLIDYNKQKAIQELEDFCDFHYYEAKHLENVLTKVIQLRWFAEKFNVDKRHSHLSSLVVSGQISRKTALSELQKPMYNKQDMEKDVEFVCMKLGISRNEFEALLKCPGKQHADYPTDKIYIWFNRFLRMPSIIVRLFKRG